MNDHQENNAAELNQNETTSQKPDALEQCQLEVAQLKDSLLRVTAEFENVRKRMEREREQWARLAQTSALEKLLPVIDNVERAQTEMPKALPTELEAWFKGFSMTVSSFKKYLEGMGVKEIDSHSFNPEFHEAILSVESDKQPGSIVQVLQKGYLFKDHVLRPAQVSVVKE